MNIKTYLKNLETQNPEAAEKVNKDLAFQVGREIERNRISRNFTQAQLAKAIGTKQSGISRLERGSMLPSLATLKRIADFFGTYIDFKFHTPEATIASYNTSVSVSGAILSSVQLPELAQFKDRFANLSYGVQQISPEMNLNRDK